MSPDQGPGDPRAVVGRAVENCVSCGACQGVCPLYQAERREELAARGKIRLLGGLLKGQATPDPALARVLSRCLLCGRCQANCPNTVAATDCQRAGREILATAGQVSLAKRLVVQGALASPSRLEALARAGRLGAGLALRLPGLAGLERLPAPAPRFFLNDAPHEVAGPQGAPRLGFFVGCVANYLRPELARRAVEILSRRYTVVIPPAQACCGLAAVAAGLTDTARDLARRNLAAFRDARVDLVFTACASCAHALAHEAPRLLGGELADQARDMAGRVREVGQILAEGRALTPAGAAGPVALHTPCHLGVGLSAGAAPAEVLTRAGVELAAWPGGNECCGGGGLFSLGEPELSRAVIAPRLAELAQGEARVLATSCSGCWLQWSRHTAPGTRVVHPLELLAP
ncbi:MAG: (Fe-S)-binding protein [Deltaproteobacteria bacterium]|nr:(Fe-S)-binding protein [Deltaproteobacteria bacterium]